LSKRPVVLLLNKLRPETRFHVLIHVYVYVVEVHKCTGEKFGSLRKKRGSKNVVAFVSVTRPIATRLPHG
jgi:hypothetical protein